MFFHSHKRVCECICAHVLCDSRPHWEGLAITPFSICCHTAHIVIPQFKGTLSGFKDLFKALILIGRSLFCHIKRGSEEVGGIMYRGWQRFLRVGDWQRICSAGRTEIWNIGHRMPAVIDMKWVFSKHERLTFPESLSWEDPFIPLRLSAFVLLPCP